MGDVVKPMKRSKAKKQIEEQAEIIADALFGATTPGMNEDAIADQMFNMQNARK